MKLLIVSNDFPERSETFIVSHALGMAARGHEVLVLARRCGASIGADELAQLARGGVQVAYSQIDGRSNRLSPAILGLLMRSPAAALGLLRPAPWSRQQMLSALAMLACIRRWRPDLIHLHYGTNGHRLSRLAGRAGLPAPALVTWHGFDANAMPGLFGMDMYEALFQRRLPNTVGSDFIRQRLLRLGADAAGIHKIPMGVDTQRFAFQPREFDGERPLRLLSVGRLAEVKGHAHLIEACRLLQRRGRAFELRIVGDGPLRAVLEQQIDASGLQDQVRLLGALPSEQVLAQYGWADLFALTGVQEANGKVESQGLVYAEAQATGLPVIASAIGGAMESLAEGRTGYACPPGDPAAIAAAIENFYLEPARLQRLGRAAREFVEAEFSLSQMLDRFEALYRSLR